MRYIELVFCCCICVCVDGIWFASFLALVVVSLLGQFCVRSGRSTTHCCRLECSANASLAWAQLLLLFLLLLVVLLQASDLLLRLPPLWLVRNSNLILAQSKAPLSAGAVLQKAQIKMCERRSDRPVR